MLYGIFDWVTMLFSPLVENIFDYAEVSNARREVRKRRRRIEKASAAETLRDAGATMGTRGGESLGW